MEKEPEILYRLFYINHGKFFVSKIENQSITKLHPTFKEDCKWFTFEQAKKLIKKRRSFPEVWGIVDENGKQLTVGHWDGILKLK